MSLPVDRDEDVRNDDRVVDRNRGTRLGIFLAAALPRFIPIALAVFIGLEVIAAATDKNIPTVISVLCGCLAGILPILSILRNYSVFVPQVQGLVTTSSRSREEEGAQVIYGPGFHFRDPTEEVTENSHFSLEILTIALTGGTVSSRDGQMLWEGQIRFKPALRRLDVYAGVHPASIVAAFTKQFEALMSADTARLTADQARASIEFLTAKHRKAFGLPQEDLPDSPEKAEFEARCGDIDSTAGVKAGKRLQLEQELGGLLIDYVVSDMDFSEAVQRARDAEAEADRLPLIIAKMFHIRLKLADGTNDPAAVAALTALTNRGDYASILSKAMVIMGKAQQSTIVTEGEPTAVIAAAFARWLRSNQP